MRVPWTYENPSCAGVGSDFFYPEMDDVDMVHTKATISICNACPTLQSVLNGEYKENAMVFGAVYQLQREKELDNSGE